MYITYDEYVELGGTFDEDTFNSYVWYAQVYIDEYTFNRLQNETEIPERVKRCMTEIMPLIYNIKNNILTGEIESSAKEIASQSNDGVSISYNILSAEQVIEKSKSEILGLIRMWLNGLRNSEGRLLLYRGIYPDE